VELRGLEPLTPCLQIAVTIRPPGPELGGGLSASDRGTPLATGGNGTLMARREAASTCAASSSSPGPCTCFEDEDLPGPQQRDHAHYVLVGHPHPDR
jgi:hypothetical protein